MATMRCQWVFLLIFAFCPAAILTAVTAQASVGLNTSDPLRSAAVSALRVARSNTAPSIINCKLARRLCAGDSACRSITTLIPRLCGQELVACSTITVTKCRAALRTLVSFQFFQPTCLCKQTHIDPECNTYRNLVFDHPCFTVEPVEKDPYPVYALPTCRYALDACRRQLHCGTLYDTFVSSCNFDDNICRMTDSMACYKAWNRLRLSPVFGCICPNVNDPDCETIFNVVHKNPCVDALPQHWHNSTWHRSHYRLHRLLSPPPSPRRPPPGSGTPRTPARTRTVASSGRRQAASPGPVSVEALGGGGGGGGRPDALLVTPLFDVHAEATHASIVQSTLYGPEHAGDVWTHRQPPRTRYHVPVTPAQDSALQPSCHQASDACLSDGRCRSRLEPVLSSCAPDTCNRNICMHRLRNFYEAAALNHSLEVAFCVCRRGPPGSAQSACLSALSQLHPVCARRPAAVVKPACHTVALRCREQAGGRCRLRLEQYEQACAVDSVTRRCAGPMAECRSAILAVLGTPLRTSCACTGTDIVSMNDCRAWERLLWNNQCVVQSQREFHQQRLTPPPPPPLPLPPPLRPNYNRPSHHRQTPQPPIATHQVTSTTSSNRWRPHERPGATRPASGPRWPTTQRRGYGDDITTAVTAGPTPGRRQHGAVCTVNIEGRPVSVISVGEGIRYYVNSNSSRTLPHSSAAAAAAAAATAHANGDAQQPDCSELCMCYGHRKLVCNVVRCVTRSSCRLEMAGYSHGSAGLIAFREGCVCDYGRFVCKRPADELYTLPVGVFLFLGYSGREEAALSPYTRLSVARDTVSQLENLLDTIMNRTGQSFQDWPCKLSVKQLFKEEENIIIQAKLIGLEEAYNQSLSPKLLLSEKKQCSRPLRDITFMINNRETDIIQHPLLSVFKMADVGVTISDPSAAARSAPQLLPLLLPPLLLLLLQLLVRRQLLQLVVR